MYIIQATVIPGKLIKFSPLLWGHVGTMPQLHALSHLVVELLDQVVLLEAFVQCKSRGSAQVTVAELGPKSNKR